MFHIKDKLIKAQLIRQVTFALTSNQKVVLAVDLQRIAL